MPWKARKISKRPLATSRKRNSPRQACTVHTLSSSTRRTSASKAPEEPRSNNNTRSKNASKQKERGEKEAQEKCASSSTPERVKRFLFFFSRSTSLSSFPVDFHSVERRRRRRRRRERCDDQPTLLLCVSKKKITPRSCIFCPPQKKGGNFFLKKSKRGGVSRFLLQNIYQHTKHLNTNTRADAHGRAIQSGTSKQRTFYVRGR